MLRPSDLSLESVLSLADLPIPGFPHTTPRASLAASTSGRGDGDVEAEPGIEGDRVTAADVGLAERTSPDEANAMVEFAVLEGGAVVKECSSSLLPTENSSRVRSASPRWACDAMRYDAICELRPGIANKSCLDTNVWGEVPLLRSSASLGRG